MSTSTPEAEAAASIRATPALLNEARGWISDAFPTAEWTAHDEPLTPLQLTNFLQAYYDGGCAEFVRNSAPLIPAPHNHIFPARPLEDTALQFTCSGCGDVVLYW